MLRPYFFKGLTVRKIIYPQLSATFTMVLSEKQAAYGRFVVFKHVLMRYEI